MTEVDVPDGSELHAADDTSVTPRRSENDRGQIDSLSPHSRARLLESVVVHANDAVVITDTESIDGSGPRIVYVNPAFTRMTGYTSDEAVGATPRTLQGPDTSALTRSLIRDALVAWRPITIQLLNYRKDGREFWVELSITPVADETGYFTHWISVQRDITERRLAEEEKTRARIAAEKYLALSTEIVQREQVEARLAYSATHDELTGLHNRSYFVERLSAAIARGKADGGYGFSMIHLDLDRFKNINDRLGYHVGDRILRDLAHRIERCGGVRDTIARIGDDGFGLLVETADHPRDGVAVAERLIAEIAARPRFDADDVVIAASIGIVHSSTEDRDAEALMRDAETALVRARQLAGNAYVVFTSEMRAEANVELRLRNDLYGAVTRDEMRLYYQPLVNVATAQIYGFEGLIRWEHPVRGLVSPADFIPIAEATGLIIEIGRWVLFEGCRMARALQSRAGKPLLMSLNVSSQQLLHPQFIEDVEAAITSSGLDPGTLQLEITESVFLAGASAVGALFGRIRELGVQIAFDDFGTGYSSLSYLERYQIDTLKIDQSFVARIADASAKSEIVRMIITLAHALGVDVVAEGVETRAQRDALGDLGCTHLQGYLFSRPLPATEALNVLSGRGPAAAMLTPLLGECGPGRLSPGQREELRRQVQAAFETHYRWMERLHSAVATGEAAFNLDEIAREDRCPIGTWLNAEISESLRGMPLYFVTKSRHAVFHRSMARLLAAVVAKEPAAGRSLRRDGDMAMAAASLVRALEDWLAVADLLVPFHRGSEIADAFKRLPSTHRPQTYASA